ncbi:MAG: hypothetical protein IJP86_01865 [Synergistaceae bacterium]|nr:hypothetical protein [Synergistaceae bacterium]
MSYWNKIPYGLRLTAYGLRLTAYGLRLTAYGHDCVLITYQQKSHHTHTVSTDTARFCGNSGGACMRLGAEE